MDDKHIARSNKPRNDLAADFVRTILDYNPDIGALSWKHRSDRRNPFAGKPITGVNGHGYIKLMICGHDYPSHRVMWPSAQIDHISGVGYDNSWTNLREANHSENCRNCKVRNTNTSGERGVSWDIRRNKWRAAIFLNGRNKHLGMFSDIKSAAAAYQKAAVEFFGEFRRRS